MKAYVVEYAFRTVVMANNESDAYIVAKDVFREVSGDISPDIDVEREVLEERHLPSGWDLDCLPYGDGGDIRLSEILSSQSP